MDEQTQTLFNAAMALSDKQRAALVRHLVQTLSPELEELLDDELAAELDRRLAEYKEGNAASIPWSTLKSQE